MRRGGEPLEWLQFVCLECHGEYHPHHTFRPYAVQQAIAKKRKQHRRVGPTCQHCGGFYSKKRHNAICRKFGLNTPYIRKGKISQRRARKIVQKMALADPKRS
jgi:hypothetical protein